jgi:hypothetical protein
LVKKTIEEEGEGIDLELVYSHLSLKKIWKKFTNIRRIELVGILTQCTDKIIQIFASKLDTLSHRISNISNDCIKTLTNLTILDLDSPHITNDAIKILTNLNSLYYPNKNHLSLTKE